MKSLKIECVGYSIAADWYDGKNEVLLVLPGYSSNKKNYKEIVSALTEQTGMAALVIDYTGHGESPYNLMELTPAQNFLEVVTAFDWIKLNHPDIKINVMGTSYGGFLATQLTKYRQFNKLVLRAPAMYKPETFYSKWKDFRYDENEIDFRSNADILIKHPLLKRAADFKGKTLVVVHEKDEFIPTAITDAYIDTFKADKYLAKDFKHSTKEMLTKPDKIKEYQTAIADWLNK